MTLDLHAEALAFAQQIQDLLDAVLPLPPGAGSQTRQVDALHLPARGNEDEVRYAVQIGEGVKPVAVLLLKGQRPVASITNRALWKRSKPAGGAGGRSQTAALVRDAPDEAARVLADLGYDVVEPAAGPAAANEKALRNW